MSFLNKKKHWNKILYSRITLGLILVLCAWVGTSVYDRYVIERDMAERRIVAEEELHELEERREMLEGKVDYLSGEQGIEAEIRKHFDVARADEQVVILVDDGKPDSVAEEHSDTNDVDTDESFWSKIIPW